MRTTKLLSGALIGAGILLFIVGSYYGLAVSPPERYMGEVQRIMYVHVPTAWTALLALGWTTVCAIAWLLSAKWRWDHRLEAGVEMSVVLCLLLSVQGAIWAKPTWGVWWDWDPRLTTVAILLMAFAGIAALRRFVEQPERRATWSAVATIIAFVDVPAVYFSVKWWNSLHQQQSTISGVSRAFLIPLLLNFAALLLFVTGVMIVRARVAALCAEEELSLEGIS